MFNGKQAKRSMMRRRLRPSHCRADRPRAAGGGLFQLQTRGGVRPAAARRRRASPNAPAATGGDRARQGVRRTTTCSSSRASPATSSTSPCSAASRPRPRSSASRSTPRARRSSTRPCRSRSSTRSMAAKPDAILIAPTDVTAMQQPARAAPPPPASRSSWSTPPPRTRRTRSRRSPRTTTAAARRRSTRSSSSTRTAARCMVMSVDPGISTTDARVKGFEDAVKADSKFQYLERAVLAQRPGHRRQPDQARRCRRTPTSSASSPPTCSPPRARPPACGRPARATRSRSSASTPARTRSRRCKEGTVQALVAQQPGTIGQYGVDMAVAALDGGTASPRRSRPGSPSSPRTTSTATAASAVYKSSC